MVQTGGIYLRSVPSGAQIFVNSKLSKNSPRLLSHLLPKKYQITLTKNGYFPWQKNLEISPKLVTEARNIILFPQNFEKELIAQNVTSTIPQYLMSEREKRDIVIAAEIASTTPGWVFQNENLFYISNTNTLYRTNLSGTFKEQVSKDQIPAGKYQIITDQKNTLLLSENQDLYLLDKDGMLQKISSGVITAQLAPDGKKFLWLKDNEIWVQWLEDILVQPYRKKGDKEMITRFAEKISQAIFYAGNEHIAFVVNDEIKIIELDGRDKRNIVDFIDAPNASLYLDPARNYFYYLTDNNLYRFRPET